MPSGLGALYAYESQFPGVASAKIEGLIDRYGIDDEETLRFFRVHETADVEHSAVCRALLDRLPEAEQAEAVAAGEELAGALWNFLSGVEARATLQLSGQRQPLTLAEPLSLTVQAGLPVSVIVAGPDAVDLHRVGDVGLDRRRAFRADGRVLDAEPGGIERRNAAHHRGHLADAAGRASRSPCRRRRH